MGCNGSKAVDTELVIRCRERRDLIKAAADHRYYLAAAHLSYFHSLKDVGDALRRFVDEELVAASSSSPSSLSSPSLILPSDERKLRADGAEGQGKRQKDSSGSSSSLHHDGEKESHLHLSSDSSDDEHFHLHDTGHNRGHFHIDEEEGHQSPASPFQHPDLPMGTHVPYVTMNQEPPPQMGYWDPFYGYNPQLNPQFQPFYGGNSNTYAYYMKRSTPTMKTVIHEAEAAPTAYSNAYWSSAYQNAGDYFGYPPVGPYMGERMRNRDNKPSPPAEPPPPPSPKASVWDFLNPFEAIDQGYSNYLPHGGYGYGSNSSSPDLKEVREREGIPDLEEETETEIHRDEPKVKKLNNEFRKKRAGEGSSTSNGVSLQRGKQLQKRMSGRKTQHIEESLATKPIPAKSSEGSSISKEPPSEDSGGSTIRLSSSGNDECSLSDMTGSIDVSEEKASSSSIVSKSPEDSSVKTKEVTFEVDHDIESSKLSNSNNKPAHGTRDLREVVAEIKDEFEIASSYGREVAVMLEVGKLPYHHSLIRGTISSFCFINLWPLYCWFY